MINPSDIYEVRSDKSPRQKKWYQFHLDWPLFFGLLALSIVGLFILYSASDANAAVIEKQGYRLVISFILMMTFAQIPPQKYKQWAPWFYGVTFFLLLAVLIIGKVDLGARRWISLGFFRFQPSELMALAMPMMLAWYLSEKPLPPTFGVILIAGFMMLFPALLIAKEPDLGTAIVVASAGFFVLLLAGIRWRLIGVIGGLLVEI